MIYGRIEGPLFVAGFEIGGPNDARVFAPIISYMKNWPLYKIVSYCTSKGWTVNVIDPAGLYARAN